MSVANSKCCKFQVLQIARVANFKCRKSLVSQIASVANCKCCKLQVLQIASVANWKSSLLGCTLHYWHRTIHIKLCIFHYAHCTMQRTNFKNKVTNTQIRKQTDKVKSSFLELLVAAKNLDVSENTQNLSSYILATKYIKGKLRLIKCIHK